MSEATELRALSEGECADLLRSHRLGRLGVGLEGWPAILPVNYLFDGTSVVIRTAPGAKLDEAPLSTVAFEIDDADRYGHWGWSVLVQGPAFDITSATDEVSEHLRALPVRPWALGARE
ncbi:MAG: pyridoxamine 5'-phosphate oxidase family protein, partial [Acidimicrobiales bacterium]